MMPIPKPDQTGFVRVKGHAIYYEVYGQLTGGTVPLLIAHGGPGSSHNYLLTLALLSTTCPVIFFDQLGTGRSEMPASDKFYTTEYFVQELDQLIKQLGLKKVNVLGHSWGGMLAIEYLRKPRPKVNKLVLASAIIDSQLYVKSTTKLMAKLGKDALRTIRKHERAGTTGSQQFQDLYAKYKKQHLFRGEVRPPETITKAENLHQYNKMWGPSEMSVSGSLKHWSGLKVLPTITQPTLVISGQFDEVTPEQNRLTTKLIPSAQSVIIPDASHLAHIEKTGLYLKALKDFLSL